MENKSQKLLGFLKAYYNDVDKLQIVLDVIHTPSKIEMDNNKLSLRLIDWLVTNYSKSLNIVYEFNGKSFNMHQSYKNMLKAYSKKMFDPFRRHNRVYIDCAVLQSKLLETTVAQLTFFKWAIENNVITYALEHKKLIKTHMDNHTQHRVNGLHCCDDKLNKRKELSKASKGANMYSVNLKVSFN